MTTDQIDAEFSQKSVPYILAKQIRQLLDKARESYPGDWETDAVETEIQTLVFE